MAQESHNLGIDYIEIPADDLVASKRFYGDVFGWTFKDHGPGYASFRAGQMRGALTRDAHPGKPGVLVVIYAKELPSIEQRIVAAGGKIARATFSFPGGRRFHFSDPSGNELAVWTEA